MTFNRSVPADTILPHVVYPNVEDAIVWLRKAFGFAEHYRYGEPGSASGAQMHLGNAWIMIKRGEPGASTPAQLGYGTQSLTVFVQDVETHCQRAKSAGATVREEPHETEYGEFQYAALDFAGHHWLFSRHACDRSPDQWGATVSQPIRQPAAKPRPSFCYIEIPALDVHQSAKFYEHLFGWNIRHRGGDRPCFDDASGHISGAWVTGRSASSTPGLLPYIWVDGIAAVLKKTESLGGVAVEAPHPDHPGGDCFIAVFRDPAGNLIGLYEEPHT